MGDQRGGQQVVQGRRTRKQRKHNSDRNHGHHGFHQPVAQLDEVLDKGLFSAGKFVFGGGGISHQLNLWGRYRATRAAPDKARVRVPVRALYHLGVAPCFTRHFFWGCRYSGTASDVS